MTRFRFTQRLAVAMLLLCEPVVHAHGGPPFPIVSNQLAGAYDISVWTDPDTTDDGTAAGQFWVVLETAGEAAIPDGTRASVAIRPIDRQGPVQEGRAEPVDGEVTRQFVALLMDHEGPFGVHVTVEGPMGRAEVESRVDATYDLRPAPALLAIFLLPFVAVGALWVKMLRRRRRPAA
jgi:hypothetical protein